MVNALECVSVTLSEYAVVVSPEWRGFHYQHPWRVVSYDVSYGFSEGCFLLFGEFRFFHFGLPC